MCFTYAALWCYQILDYDGQTCQGWERKCVRKENAREQRDRGSKGRGFGPRFEARRVESGVLREEGRKPAHKITRNFKGKNAWDNILAGGNAWVKWKCVSLAWETWHGWPWVGSRSRWRWWQSCLSSPLTRLERAVLKELLFIIMPFTNARSHSQATLWLFNLRNILQHEHNYLYSEWT